MTTYEEDKIPIPPDIRRAASSLALSGHIESRGDQWLADLWLKDDLVPKSAVIWLEALRRRGGVRYDDSNKSHHGPTFVPGVSPSK